MVAVVDYAAQVRDVLIAHARALQPSLFVTVNGAEPKSAPVSTGVTAAIMEGQGQVLPLASSLAALSIEYVTTVHLFRKLNLGQKDRDPSIDEAFEPELTTARDTYVALLMSDLTGGTLALASGQEFNPTGAYGGTTLGWGPAYVEIDGQNFRTQSITIPAIVFNAWSVTR